ADGHLGDTAEREPRDRDHAVAARDGGVVVGRRGGRGRLDRGDIGGGAVAVVTAAGGEREQAGRDHGRRDAEQMWTHAPHYVAGARPVRGTPTAGTPAQRGSGIAYVPWAVEVILPVRSSHHTWAVPTTLRRLTASRSALHHRRSPWAGRR